MSFGVEEGAKGVLDIDLVQWAEQMEEIDFLKLQTPQQTP